MEALELETGVRAEESFDPALRGVLGRSPPLTGVGRKDLRSGEAELQALDFVVEGDGVTRFRSEDRIETKSLGLLLVECSG